MSKVSLQAFFSGYMSKSAAFFTSDGKPYKPYPDLYPKLPDPTAKEKELAAWWNQDDKKIKQPESTSKALEEFGKSWKKAEPPKGLTGWPDVSKLKKILNVVLRIGKAK